MRHDAIMKSQQQPNLRRHELAKRLWVKRSATIEHMYLQEGHSQAAIAEHFGVAQAVIHKWMVRLGIPARSRGRSGAANGRFIHGKESTIYRTMIEKKACAQCGTRENLCVHHVNGDHFDNRPANLQVLCSPCHSSHHKKEYWEAWRKARRSRP